MKVKNTAERYGSISIGLHWLTFAVLVAVYACINLTEAYPEGSNFRDSLKSWHFMLGLTVLILAASRLASRIGRRAPGITPPLPLWQSRLAGAIHVALYAVMIAMPTLGWLMLSAAGKPIPFFGSLLPPLLAENRDLAHQLKEVHEVIGTIGYFLIGAHISAGLFHHFVTRDDTLVRMLPGLSSHDSTASDANDNIRPTV
jgi:cytochrome b561